MSEGIAICGAEARALAEVLDRHHDGWVRAIVEPYRDSADVGWLSVHVPILRGSRRCDAHYVLSSTGRAWKSHDGIERGEQIREADYDRKRPREAVAA